MVNTDKLNSVIKEKGYTKESIARRLGISRQSLSNKINNKTPFRDTESLYLKELLELSDVQFVSIFFVSEFDNKSKLEVIYG